MRNRSQLLEAMMKQLKPEKLKLFLKMADEYTPADSTLLKYGKLYDSMVELNGINKRHSVSRLLKETLKIMSPPVRCCSRLATCLKALNYMQDTEDGVLVLEGSLNANMLHTLCREMHELAMLNVKFGATSVGLTKYPPARTPNARKTCACSKTLSLEHVRKYTVPAGDCSTIMQQFTAKDLFRLLLRANGAVWTEENDTFKVESAMDLKLDDYDDGKVVKVTWDSSSKSLVVVSCPKDVRIKLV
jgi:hypothetical protein